MKEEQLDILNETGEKTGKYDTYDNVHLHGLIHRAVHVWLINFKNELLLQERSKDKRAYPSYWDISAAGHISSGETSLQAAKREIKEELNVDLLDSELKLLAKIRQPIVRHSSTFIDSEFNDVYLVHCNLAVSEFKIQTEEVEKIRWVSVEDFKKWVDGKGEKLVPHKNEYKILFGYLSVNS